MQIELKNLDNGIHYISLIGRMDVKGTQEIDMKFTALVATNESPVIVDLSEVDMITSIGIRTLISNAKALNVRGGKMVMFNPQSMVKNVLTTAGIDKLIEIHGDLDTACAAVLG